MAGQIWENPVLDPFAVLPLNNPLYIFKWLKLLKLMIQTERICADLDLRNGHVQNECCSFKILSDVYFHQGLGAVCVIWSYKGNEISL